MDVDSKTARLCIAGTQAEFARDLEAARRLFSEAWDAAVDDYDAAMAAHYIAHLEPDSHEALRWNLIALDRASLDVRADPFMGSLLVSLGGAYEAVNESAEAERYHALAAERGIVAARRIVPRSVS